MPRAPPRLKPSYIDGAEIRAGFATYALHGYAGEFSGRTAAGPGLLRSTSCSST
jgi:hypothetical protein